MRKKKYNKASGADGIPAEDLRCGGNALAAVLRGLRTMLAHPLSSAELQGCQHYHSA